jgi:hypothetical protein
MSPYDVRRLLSRNPLRTTYLKMTLVVIIPVLDSYPGSLAKGLLRT